MALNALKVLHYSSAPLLLHTSLVHHSSPVPGSVSDAQLHSILHRVLPVLGAGCSKLRLLAGVSLVADILSITHKSHVMQTDHALCQVSSRFHVSSPHGHRLVMPASMASTLWSQAVCG